MKESRREFIKKAGKTILTGVGWTAVSLLGLESTGCGSSNSGYGCTYSTDCSYSCNTCTSYNYGDDVISTLTRISLNGSGFIYDASNYYTIILSSAYDKRSVTTNEFGNWNGNSFYGILSILHKKDEVVSITAKKRIFSSPEYYDQVLQSYNTYKDEIDITFNWFPVGAYFNVRYNNTSVSNVIVSITQNGSPITSGTTDSSGIVKFYCEDPNSITPGTNYPLKVNTSYTATFSKTGLGTTTKNFTINYNQGIISSVISVVDLF